MNKNLLNNNAAAAANAKTENENWQKFKSDSDEKMHQIENRVDEFRRQSGRIKHKLKPGYNQKDSTTAIQKSCAKATDAGVCR